MYTPDNNNNKHENNEKHKKEKKSQLLTRELSLFAKVWLSMIRGGRRQRRKVPNNSQPITFNKSLKLCIWRKKLIFCHFFVKNTTNILVTWSRCRFPQGSWHTPLDKAWKNYSIRFLEAYLVSWGQIFPSPTSSSVSRVAWPNISKIQGHFSCAVDQNCFYDCHFQHLLSHGSLQSYCDGKTHQNNLIKSKCYQMWNWNKCIECHNFRKRIKASMHRFMRGNKLWN